MSSPVAVPEHRATLWKALLVAEFNVCYWTLLARRETKIEMAVKGVSALSPAVAAWTIWAHSPVILTMLSMAVPVGTWFHSITNDRLKRIASLVGSWKQIAIEYDLLWQFDSDLASPETWKRFEEATKLQAKTDETGLPIIDKLREKAFAQMMKNRGY